MRLTVAIPALVVTICTALLVYALAITGMANGRPQTARPPTGVDLLRAYACQRGETKHIVMRGAEDGFSPAGEEPGFVRPARRNARTLSFFGDGGIYDQYQPDRRFTDSFQIPGNISNGIFVISLRSIGSNSTDTFSIGDQPDGGSTDYFSFGLQLLDTQPGWRRAGSLVQASLADIALSSRNKLHPGHRTLLDYVNAAGERAWIDVNVQDDTSVDFMGMAICQRPPRDFGITLAPGLQDDRPAKGVVVLACRLVGWNNHICNPYHGDMPCTRPLPLACFKPGEAPTPRDLNGRRGARSWSGGSVAVTEAVPASRFRTIRDADHFCAGRFGPDWRTAAFHDGVVDGIAAFGDRQAIQSRVWVDIADQPYATCWTR